MNGFKLIKYLNRSEPQREIIGYYNAPLLVLIHSHSVATCTLTIRFDLMRKLHKYPATALVCSFASAPEDAALLKLDFNKTNLPGNHTQIRLLRK